MKASTDNKICMILGQKEQYFMLQRLHVLLSVPISSFNNEPLNQTRCTKHGILRIIGLFYFTHWLKNSTFISKERTIFCFKRKQKMKDTARVDSPIGNQFQIMWPPALDNFNCITMGVNCFNREKLMHITEFLYVSR